MLIKAFKMGLGNIKEGLEKHDFAWEFEEAIVDLYGGIKRLIVNLFLIAICPVLLPLGLVLQTFYSYQKLNEKKVNNDNTHL